MFSTVSQFRSYWPKNPHQQISLPLEPTEPQLPVDSPQVEIAGQSINPQPEATSWLRFYQDQLNALREQQNRQAAHLYGIRSQLNPTQLKAAQKQLRLLGQQAADLLAEVHQQAHRDGVVLKVGMQEGQVYLDIVSPVQEQPMPLPEDRQGEPLHLGDRVQDAVDSKPPLTGLVVGFNARKIGPLRQRYLYAYPVVLWDWHPNERLSVQTPAEVLQSRLLKLPREPIVSTAAIAFHLGERVVVVKSLLAEDIGRIGTVQARPGTQELEGQEKVLLDGDRICRYFQREWLERSPRTPDVEEKCSGGSTIDSGVYQTLADSQVQFEGDRSDIRFYVQEDLPPEHFSDRAEALHDDLAHLERQRAAIQEEGPIAATGSWIETYTATRKRKSGKVVRYTYYRLRHPGAGPGEPKHQSLGKAGSVKYLAARQAIARRNELERIDRHIRLIEKRLEQMD